MGEVSKTINSILIANRGEIAVRIIKTAKQMGLRTIAVYSSVDADAMHAKMADDAVMIGDGPAAQSYLSTENIIAAAQGSGADAIHPGYGFLSENAWFARACDKAAIKFIGPSPQAMEIMGNKASAKKRMHECKVACIPGYEGEDQSDEALALAAAEIGFPLMVKAAAGGGGRGMRLVENPDKLKAALQQARSEALGGFGSAQLILEKAVTNARHIEFQILGDAHGHIIHLGERDCSLQRRHQKVIEEAPSPAVDEDLRQVMGKAAVKAARAVSYVGAGTVEFLLDEDSNFFFLEMNTRLQVEHPVTEMVTGLDLVEWQIRIARAEQLSLGQSQVIITGHAIEARLYAEDPAKDFMPSTGRIEKWVEPAGEAVRVDSAIVTGDEISPHYDAMVAKIIVHKNNREEARLGLINALDDAVLFGPGHNKDFLRRLLGNESFIKGNATTDLIAREYDAHRLASSPPHLRIACFAAVLDFVDRRNDAWSNTLSVHEALLDWSSSPLPGTRFRYQCADAEFDILVHARGNGEYKTCCKDEGFDIVFSDLTERATINGTGYVADAFMRAGTNCYLAIGGRGYRFVDKTAVWSGTDDRPASGAIGSPMHGNLVEVNAEVGMKVSADTTLGVLEAMKMRHEILAGVVGVVKQVHQQSGAQVGAGDKLFEIEVEGETNATGE